MIVSVPVMMHFVRQRLRSPGRLALLAFALGSPLLGALVMPAAGLGALGSIGIAIVVISSGLIGQDVASGTLQLVLARPLTRAAYVTSKWLAATALAFALFTAQVLIGSALLASRGHAPALRDMGIHLGQGLFEAAGVAAVFTLLSSLLAGFGDVFLMAVVFTTFTIAGQVAMAQRWHVFERVAIEAQRFLWPQLPLAGLLAGEPSWFQITSYLSTVTLALALAIVVLNRKELSYASASG